MKALFNLYFIILLFSVILLSCSGNKIDYAALKEAQDYNVPVFKDTLSNKKVLLIFPHTDDEIHCAGTILYLKENGYEINIVTLTQGQEPEEKHTRKAEWEKAIKILGIDNGELLDLKNNSWENVLSNQVEFWYDNTDSVEKIVLKYINKYNPGIIITYDDAIGGYGHPEHRVTARAIKNVFQKYKADSLFPVKQVLHSTLPEKLEQIVFAGFEPYENAKSITGNTGLPEPDLAFDVYKYWDSKRNASLQYVSQAASLKKFFLLPELSDTAAHFKTFSREYFSSITNQ